LNKGITMRIRTILTGADAHEGFGRVEPHVIPA
jgi:hypothetical protein